MSKTFYIFLLMPLLFFSYAHCDKFEDFLSREIKDLQIARYMCLSSLQNDLDIQQLYYIEGEIHEAEVILSEYKDFGKKND